jgi:hypothetical protein
MTEAEFLDGLKKLGFTSTSIISTFGRMWEHKSGQRRMIQEPQYLSPRLRKLQIEKLANSLGVTTH